MTFKSLIYSELIWGISEGRTHFFPQTVEIINLSNNLFPHQLGMTLLLETKFSFVYESIPRLSVLLPDFIIVLFQTFFLGVYSYIFLDEF